MNKRYEKRKRKETEHKEIYINLNFTPAHSREDRELKSYLDADEQLHSFISVYRANSGTRRELHCVGDPAWEWDEKRDKSNVSEISDLRDS